MREEAQSSQCIANQQILLKTIRRSIGSLFALTSLFLANISDAADLSAAEIFTDGMVLQQQMDVPVRGNASAGDMTQVNFGGRKQQPQSIKLANEWRSLARCRLLPNPAPWSSLLKRQVLAFSFPMS